MNWYETWTHIVADLETDPEIVSVLGEGEECGIFLAGERELRIPSMTGMLVTDIEGEVWAPADWQFDIYAFSLAEIVRVERAMRVKLNQPLTTTMGGVSFASEFISGQLLRGPQTDPYFRRLLEFRFTPVRSRYYRPQPVGA